MGNRSSHDGRVLVRLLGYRLLARLFLVCAAATGSHTVQSESPPIQPPNKKAGYITASEIRHRSLTLRLLLDTALATNPTLIAGRLDAQASEFDVEAAERQRWPTVSVTTESNTGNQRSYPSQALEVNVILWDKGKTTARIAEAKSAAQSGQVRVELVKQDLFLQIVAAWQGLLGATEKQSVASRTLERLKVYQAQMQRRVALEASPRIDLELVNARLLQTEVELTEATTGLQQALVRLEQLSGMDGLTGDGVTLPDLQSTQEFLSILEKTDPALVANNHPVVMKARLEAKQMEERLTSKKAEAWPQVFLRSYQPLGTVPTSNEMGMTTFIGMRYTPGAGASTLVEAKALATRLEGSQQAIESTTREMRQVIRSDRDEFINARTRFSAIEKSIHGADQVLESYLRQFQAGRKSWLDVLNAVRELAQNQYALANTRATMAASMYRLQIRIGLDPH